VAPVIAVVLVVALTVILAATVGAFVFDIGTGTQKAPNVVWDWEYDSTTGTATATITGGDQIRASQLSGIDSTNSSPGFTVTDKNSDGWLTSTESVTFDKVSDYDTLKIVWRDEEGDTRTVVSEVTVPTT